jgi:hypothetical protein
MQGSSVCMALTATTSKKTSRNSSCKAAWSEHLPHPFWLEGPRPGSALRPVNALSVHLIYDKTKQLGPAFYHRMCCVPTPTTKRAISLCTCACECGTNKQEYCLWQVFRVPDAIPTLRGNIDKHLAYTNARTHTLFH